MSYLVCDKCGGYYKLQEKENPDDFTDKCECGGTLKCFQNLDDHVIDKLDPRAGINICPNCGKENKINVNFCQNCGKKLNQDINEFYKSHQGLIVVGYILAIFGLLFGGIGTLAAIIIGIILYGKENPKDRRNGKYILIIAIVIPIIIIISISTLIIYNSYFTSSTFDDISSVRSPVSPNSRL